MVPLDASYRKCVSFADDKNTRHVYDARSTDVLWEWPEFFEQSRKQARREGSKLQKQGFKDLLEGCFGNDRNDVQKSLNDYAKLCDGRGIERYASREMYAQRKDERSKAIQAILIGQRQAKERGMPQNVMAEELRDVYLVYCLNAKVFARRLGKADEAACYKKQKRSSIDSKLSYLKDCDQSTCSATTHTTQSSISSHRSSRAA
jgi:hypothetical protein